MARGGKRAGAGRKPNLHKGKRAEAEALKIPPKTVYEPWVSTQAQKLSFLGATDLEIADFLGITTTTFYQWRHEFPDFSEAVKVGKEAADDRVEKSFYNRAIGYTFESEKIAINAFGKVTRASCREHVPPDPGAAMNWLKNRRPNEWREKTEILHKYDSSTMSDNDLERIASGGGDGTVAAKAAPSKLN